MIHLEFLSSKKQIIQWQRSPSFSFQEWNLIDVRHQVRAEIVILCIKGKLTLLVAFEMHCWALILGSLPLSGLFFQIDSFLFHYQTLPFDSLTNVLLVSIVTIMEQN